MLPPNLWTRTQRKAILRLMFTECPLCLSRVLPMANGHCPSCQGDMASAPLPNVAKLEIAQSDELPDICATCGADTPTREVVWASPSEGMGVGQRTIIAIILAIISWPLLLLLKMKELRGKPPEWSVKVPRCRPCMQDSELIPNHVNEARHSMTFLVIRNFADVVNREEAAAAPQSAAASPYPKSTRTH